MLFSSLSFAVIAFLCCSGVDLTVRDTGSPNAILENRAVIPLFTCSGHELTPLPLPFLRCKKKVPASKRFTIHRTSNVLTLSLKRFANFSGGKITKVSTHLSVPACRAGGALKYRFQALPQSQ